MSPADVAALASSPFTEDEPKPPLVAAPAQPLAAVIAVHTQLSREMHDFRRLCASLTLATIGAMAVTCLWAVNHAGVLTRPARYVAMFLPIVIGVFGLYVTRMLHDYFRDIARVIRNLDEALGLHTPGAYLPGRSLYPEHWKTFGTSRWDEPTFRVSAVSLSFAILVIGTILGAVFL